MTLQEVLTYDGTVGHRPIEKYSYAKLCWWCYYLQYVHAFDHLDCAAANNTALAPPVAALDVVR